MNNFAQLREWLDRYRLKMASPQAAIALALFGLMSGILSGALIVLFRLLIEAAQEMFMGPGQNENFEALPAIWRFVLPAAGALLIGLVYQFISESRRRVGVIHVMERLQYHEGHLPFKNLFIQFFGGVGTDPRRGHARMGTVRRLDAISGLVGVENPVGFW